MPTASSVLVFYSLDWDGLVWFEGWLALPTVTGDGFAPAAALLVSTLAGVVGSLVVVAVGFGDSIGFIPVLMTVPPVLLPVVDNLVDSAGFAPAEVLGAVGAF